MVELFNFLIHGPFSGFHYCFRSSRPFLDLLTAESDRFVWAFDRSRG